MESLNNRRRPQQTHPMTEHLCLFHNLGGTAVRNGDVNNQWLCILTQIALTQEMAVLAVALVVVLYLKMSGTLQAVVVEVDGLMVDMDR